MLNEISAMPPINQLSVTNMAVITPIGKVKTFQFNNPTNSTPSTMIWSNSQTQISPAYFLSYILNNGSPIQIQPNNSNPPSVSMLSANNLQIPNNTMKNTNSNSNNQMKKDEQRNTNDKKNDDKTWLKSKSNNKFKTQKT